VHNGSEEEITLLGLSRVAAAIKSFMLQLPADAGLPRQLIPRPLTALVVPRMVTRVRMENCIVTMVFLGLEESEVWF
jgi:hypothetical protein